MNRSKCILVLAAGGALAVVAGCAGASPADGEALETEGSRAEGPEESDASDLQAACVEEYRAETLAGRAFAFDGTATEVSDTPGDAGYVDVTFTVNEWFRGGEGATVTVALLAPTTVTSAGGLHYGSGTRLLVAGEPRWGGAPLDEPVAWLCGFTRPHDPDTAAEWRTVFAEASG